MAKAKEEVSSKVDLQKHNKLNDILEKHFKTISDYFIISIKHTNTSNLLNLKLSYLIYLTYIIK